MLKIKFCLTGLALSLLMTFVCIAQTQTDGARFKGQIAENKVEMTLQRSGNELKGSYFYSKIGSANPLTLRGKIENNNKFVLQEFDGAGKQTGEFSGEWKDGPNEPGSILEGEWKKPNAKESQSFWAWEQMISLPAGWQINSKQIRENFKAKRLDVEAEYPEIVGGNNAGVTGFNQTAKTIVTKEVAEFKKTMLAQTAEDLKYLPQDVNNSMGLGFNVELATDELISIHFGNSTYTGGAHGNFNSFTLNYDLKNNKEIKLAELFKPGSKYLEKIAAIAKADLQSRKMPDSDENMGLATDLWEEGVAPTPENFASWNITKKGLMFMFDPYQVGPYAAGPQTVIVPYAKLKDIIKPDGALAKMMR